MELCLHEFTLRNGIPYVKDILSPTVACRDGISQRGASVFRAVPRFMVYPCLAFLAALAAASLSPNPLSNAA